MSVILHGDLTPPISEMLRISQSRSWWLRWAALTSCILFSVGCIRWVDRSTIRFSPLSEQAAQSEEEEGRGGARSSSPVAVIAWL